MFFPLGWGSAGNGVNDGVGGIGRFCQVYCNKEKKKGIVWHFGEFMDYRQDPVVLGSGIHPPVASLTIIYLCISASGANDCNASLKPGKDTLSQTISQSPMIDIQNVR